MIVCQTTLTRSLDMIKKGFQIFSYYKICAVDHMTSQIPNPKLQFSQISSVRAIICPLLVYIGLTDLPNSRRNLPEK